MRFHRFVSLIAAGAILVAAAPPGAAATLPVDFTEQLVASGLASPTAMAFAPDGRLFVCEQTGRLRVIKDGTLLTTPFVTLPVSSSGERGLLGVAFDPDFATNQHVYVYYTATTPTVRNRVSRFTASGDEAVPGSELHLLDLENLFATNHNGGAIHFGADGKLYIAVGDNAVALNAQSFGNRLGKILRINADGSIPTDNPFFSTATGANRAIWALGLRNPYTFAFQPLSGRMFINDVGENTWEEINEGVAGANYGWPTTEGPTNDPRFNSPLYAYDHSTGCAITGGAFYNPETGQFPPAYTGSYFFADFCGGWINRRDAGDSVSEFASDIASPVDLQVSSDGSLFYLARGAGGATGAVFRIQFGSAPPSITMNPTDQSALPGGSATFTATASGTPPLTYRWQRDGSDIPGATGSSYTLSPVLVGDDGAQFRIVVSNAFGTATSQAARLIVLNTPPVGTITHPLAGTTYAGGSLITYSGTATDAEDGTLPPSAFTWRVDFHHDTHSHPFVPDTAGVTSGSFVVPTAGETSANVWYRITLTVTDSRGLQHTSFRDVLPRTVQMTITSTPPGLQVALDGQPQITPFTVTGVVGITRNLSLTSPQAVNGTGWEFLAWSDGGAATHDISTPPVSGTFTATFRAICPVDVISLLNIATIGPPPPASGLFVLWVVVQNKTLFTIRGPFVLVLGGLQGAVVVGGESIVTSCGAAAVNPGVVFHAGDDQLRPLEIALFPVLLLRVGTAPVAAIPSVLAGLPAR